MAGWYIVCISSRYCYCLVLFVVVVYLLLSTDTLKAIKSKTIMINCKKFLIFIKPSTLINIIFSVYWLPSIHYIKEDIERGCYSLDLYVWLSFCYYNMWWWFIIILNGKILWTICWYTACYTDLTNTLGLDVLLFGICESTYVFSSLIK